MLAYTKVQNIWNFIPLAPSKQEKKLSVLLSLFLREVCLLHNNCPAEKRTKHSSNILLHLVRFSAQGAA